MPETTEAEKLLGKFTEATDALSEQLTKQEVELKSYGETKAETAKAIETIGADVLGMREEFTKLEAKLKEMTLAGQRPGGTTDGGELENKSIGERFLASDQFKQMVAMKSRNSSPVEVGSFLEMERKTLLTTVADASVTTGLVAPQRVADIILPPTIQPKIADLLSRVTTQAGSIQYVRETRFNHIYTELSADEASGQVILSVKNTYGFYPGQAIIVDAQERIVDSVQHGDGTITVTVALSPGESENDPVTGTLFVCTPEAMLKPAAEPEMELKTEIVKTLPHWVPASRQVLSDAPALKSYIDTRLLEGIKLSRDRMLLYGDASSEQLAGILNDADRLTYSWSAGKLGDTKMDALKRGSTFCSLLGYPTTGVAVHPIDWEDIALAKGSDGHYIWMQVAAGVGNRIFGFPVIESSQLVQGTAVTGAWAYCARLWDREQASIRTSENYKDFFVRNLVAILAEERLCVTWELPNGFCEVTFDNAPV